MESNECASNLKKKNQHDMLVMNVNTSKNDGWKVFQ